MITLTFLSFIPKPVMGPQQLALHTCGRQVIQPHAFLLTFDPGAQLVSRETSLESWDPEKIRSDLLGLLLALTSLFPKYHEIPTSDPPFAQLAIFEESGRKRLGLISYF